MKRIKSLAVAAAVPLLLLAGSAAAQPVAYPSKPVRVVVPSATGGSSDILGRLLADQFSERLGQRFIVENKPGAASIVGVDFVAKAPGDGYTLLIGAINSHATNQHLYKSLPYDPVKDFTPVSLITKTPNLLVVHPGVPAKSVAELIALLKQNPDKYSFASSGAGTSLHLSGELFKLVTGTSMTHVPYKGSGPAMVDLIAGHVQIAFDNMSSTLPHVQAGRLRALGITSATRSVVAPDVPPVGDTVPNFEVTAWHALYAPAGTPREIVNRLAGEVAQIVKLPAMDKRLRDLGATPQGSSAAELAAFQGQEIKKWEDVIRSAKISAQ
jgi:tripartite-type tricarboxylate transporter receptor subunit TctC